MNILRTLVLIIFLMMLLIAQFITNLIIKIVEKSENEN